MLQSLDGLVDDLRRELLSQSREQFENRTLLYYILMLKRQYMEETGDMIGAA